MNRQQLLARMNEIAELLRNGSTDEDLINEYETHEAVLQRMNRVEGIQGRNVGYNGANPGIPSNRQQEDLSDTQYVRAFDAYMRSGVVNSDLIQSRAQSEGVGSQGGYLVPNEVRNRIVDRLVAFGGLASVVDDFTTGDGRRVSWPTVDDTANVGEIVVENGTFVGGADIVFGSAQLDAYTYASGGAGGNPLRIPFELAQDTAFDLQGMVSNKLSMRIRRIQAQHLVSGTGVNEPLGITTGLTGVEIAADTAGITYADLLNFVHSVDPDYRAMGSRWAFNDTSLQTIRGLLDGNDRPILKGADEGVSGDPGGMTLLGYPVTIDQGFPNFVANDNTINWGVFGALREGYVVRRVREVELLVNPYSRMNFRQIEYSMWARMDATQQNTNAYVALTGEA